MIQIRRNHPIVKLAFLFNGMEPPRYGRYGLPYQTSLCPLFWRCVLTVVGVLGFTTMIIGLLAFISVKLYHVPAHTWLLIGAGVGCGLVVALAIFGLVELALRFKWGKKIAAAVDRADEKITTSVAAQTVKAVKSKICPLVTFTEVRQ